MYIENLIGDLLVRNNCVIIPSFGGFLAKKVSATVDHTTGVMNPPRRLISFNRQLINNDGLLIASYAFQANTTYEQAHFEIEAQIEQWMLRLNNGERISIERIGFLFLDQEKNIGFEQDKFVNVYLQSFGMKSIHFISNEDIQLITEAETTEIENPIEVSEKSIFFDSKGISEELSNEEMPVYAEKELAVIKPRLGWWKYAAAAVLLPVAFYSFWIPMKTDVLNSGIIAINDFNPFYKKCTIQYKSADLSAKKIDTTSVQLVSVDSQVKSLPNDVDVLSYQFSEDLYIPVKVDTAPKLDDLNINDKAEDVKSVETPIEAVKKYIPETIVSQTENYYLIANCFGNETNALNYVKFLNSKGFSASIVDQKNGLYRVSAGRAESSSALRSIEEKLKSLDVQGAWILKK